MTETLTYEVEKKENNFEIRKYSDHIMAHVDVEAPFNDAMNIGFRILASYIFGNNRKRSNIEMTVPVGEEKRGSEKIPMTAPVTEEATGDIHRISFVMPSKYSLDILPEPEDNRIKIEEVKGERMAALRFKGRVNEKLANEKIEKMKNWLKENDINPKSNFVVAQYNNPAVPGFLRRNEILVEI
jgi:hypothetical protein